MAEVHEVSREHAGHLAGLRAAVERLGFRCAAARLSSGQPCLQVVNPDLLIMEEKVYVALVGAEPWFWWGWGQRIAPVDHVDFTATEIVRVLAAI